MKFIAGQLIILLLISGTLAGQNLCTNGDFDTYTTLPNNYAQVCYANGWSSPSGACALVVGTGSPDYYNTGGTGGCKPPTTWWATVTPHSGAGMEGFAAVSYTHLRAHETVLDLVCRLLLVKKKTKKENTVGWVTGT